MLRETCGSELATLWRRVSFTRRPSLIRAWRHGSAWRGRRSLRTKLIISLHFKHACHFQQDSPCRIFLRPSSHGQSPRPISTPRRAFRLCHLRIIITALRNSQTPFDYCSNSPISMAHILPFHTRPLPSCLGAMTCPSPDHFDYNV